MHNNFPILSYVNFLKDLYGIKKTAALFTIRYEMQHMKHYVVLSFCGKNGLLFRKYLNNNKINIRT